MDARTAKRVARVEHIKQQAYYSFACDRPEPDPLSANVSTRLWKHNMRVWVNALKASCGGAPKLERIAGAEQLRI